MHRQPKLTSAMVLSLLLFGVSAVGFAQDAQKDPLVAQNSIVASPQLPSAANDEVQPQSPTPFAVNPTKTSPGNVPVKMTLNSVPQQNGNQSSNAGQEPKPLTRKFEIPGKGITVNYPDDWSVGPKRFTNLDEIIDIAPGQKNKPITSKLKITTEERKNAAEALRRLDEIRSGIGAPTSAFLTIGGWPAIQYGRIEERPSPGPDEFPRPQFKDKNMYKITTAIAAGDQVVRLEASLPSDASPGLIRQAEAISRSLLFSAKADPKKTATNLERLQKNARPNRPPLAIVPPGQVAAAFTPLPKPQPSTGSGGGGRSVLAPAMAQVPAGESQPGLTQRVITGNFGELEIAASPNGQTIVIGQQSAWRTSTNGGQTFAFNGVINAFDGGDPSLGWGQSGAFYYAGIDRGCQPSDATGPFGYACTGMARSTNNGQTFPLVSPAVVCPNPDPAGDVVVANSCFPDQEHIAVDRVNAGTGVTPDQVYSAWRNFDATDQDPGLVCSSNGGQTWSAPIVVGTGAFPRIAAGQDGFVYVTWLDGGNYMVRKYSSCASGLVSVSGPTVITTRDPIVCPFPGHDRCDQNPSSQTIAVDDTNPNHVYFSYAETAGTATNDRIMVRDSLDGGVTWPAVRVAQVSSALPGKRIMPWVCTTGGEAIVTWYDRRAAPPTQNDLTDYFMGRVRIDGATNLIVGSEIKLSEVGDPWCASGWPCGTRGAPGASEQCSVQPQLAGFCCSSLDTNGNCVGSGNRCDFSDGCSIGGETCQGIGGGCPKYGDYNGNACVAGRILAAYASATSPASVSPPSNSIDIFFTSQIVGDVPQIQIPGSVFFGDVCVSATATQTLNVCNTGKSNLEVNNITSDNAQFVVTTPTQGYPVVISPDFCFPFQVTFTPTSTGSKTANLTVVSNDPARPSVVVQASGAGTRQAIDTLIPNSGNFGQVCVGSFKDLNMTINNSGGCDLVVNSVTSIGADAAQFIVAGDNTYPITVAPGTSVQVPIRFQPTSIGNKSASIRVNSNDPTSPNKDVPVSGHADPGDIRVTGSTAFGEVCGGALAEKTVSICNVANSCDLHVTGAVLTNAAGDGACADFTIVNNPFPATVSHDFCVPLTIRFTPTTAGPKQCRLVISSDDPDSPVVTQVITADTPLASIDVSPNQSFLPEVVQSIGFCTTLQPFPISNKGTCPVKVTDVSIVGNDPNFGLSALPSFPINLQPGHTVGDGNLQTVFKPLAPVARERAGVLSVTYESDPIAHVLTTETRDLCGEAVNTGARVLVRSAGEPVAIVESIRLNRINANRNKNNVDTVDNARNLAVTTFTYPAGSACTAFQYHREYGTASNPIQLLPGSYTVTVAAVVNGKRKSKTVAFDVQTCDFNPTVIVDL